MAGGCEGICCDECGAEITWTPIVIDGRPYCCHDCGVGVECDCASGDPRGLDDAPASWDAPAFWVGSVEEGAESSYGIDYYAFE
jgi:hypothetical protein